MGRIKKILSIARTVDFDPRPDMVRYYCVVLRGYIVEEPTNYCSRAPAASWDSRLGSTTTTERDI